MTEERLMDIEIDLLLEGIQRLYGYDFRDYSRPYIKRRIETIVGNEDIISVSGLQEKVLHDRSFMGNFIQAMTNGVTEIFRDSTFYLSLRQNIVPKLKNLTHCKIWVVGCGTGEEVVSLAILFSEEGMLNNTRIYATDLNELSLKKAADGFYTLSLMQAYSENYILAGGSGSLSDYYVAMYGNAVFRKELIKNVTWACHNLVTDGSFNEFDLILCRNVLIYFNKRLQDKVHKLIFNSLAINGYLVLGNKELINFTSHEKYYRNLDFQEKIYQKTHDDD